MPKYRFERKSGVFLEPIYLKGLTLKKPAVLVDADEYEGMKETIDILLNEPDILKKLKKAETDLKKGKTFSWEKIKHELGI